MAIPRILFLALALGRSAVDAARVRRSPKASKANWRAVLLPGQLEIKRPAFLFHDKAKDQILVSQFGKATKSDSWMPIPLPAASTISAIPMSTLISQKRSGRMSGNISGDAAFVTDGAMLWPNKLDRVPSEYGDYIVIPDGFLPPGKNNGNIYLANSSGSLFRITAKERGACYHEIEWFDFNGDGLQDMLTARFVVGGPIWAPTFTGSMVWFENPGASRITEEWTKHMVAEGPDVIFKKVPYGNGFAIFATEFWNEKLTVKFVSKQGVMTSSRVIDSEVGKAFAVDVTDVDGDGVDDLLVTNHQDDRKDAIKAGVYAYEIPSDLESGTFKKHILAQNISDMKDWFPGSGSPGFAHAFYPKTGMSGFKHVLVAGDGTFDVWYLTPTSTRWEYEWSLIPINGTTGQMMLHDFDNDGVMDVLVPDNDLWKLNMISFEQ